jgi:hypothetical protein
LPWWGDGTEAAVAAAVTTDWDYAAPSVAVISDAVTRVTRVEERLRRLEQKPLPSNADRLLPEEGATANG